MAMAPFLAAAAFAAGCPAAPVQHGYNAASPGEIAPWVAAGEGRAAMVGSLGSPYSESLGDRRVREARGIVLYAARVYKIGWLPRRWAGTGNALVLEGRRLDGLGTVRGRYRRAVSRPLYPAELALPSAGCWLLTLRTGSRRWALHVLALEAPAEAPCDTTPVRTGPNPVDPLFTRWVGATPASSVITATFSLQIPGVDGAAIYAGGRAPDGSNTKVLWRARGNSMPLRLRWTRLDGPESFHQTLNAAGGDVGAYPSIPVVPAAGCWLLQARVDGRGGVIVLRALPVPE